MDRLLQSGGELVTLVTGEPARRRPRLADGIRRACAATTPDVDLVVYDGGQPHCPLIIGVE